MTQKLKTQNQPEKWVIQPDKMTVAYDTPGVLL